jgi:hypothetical protein
MCLVLQVFQASRVVLCKNEAARVRERARVQNFVCCFYWCFAQVCAWACADSKREHVSRGFYRRRAGGGALFVFFPRATRADWPFQYLPFGGLVAFCSYQGGSAKCTVLVVVRDQNSGQFQCGVFASSSCTSSFRHFSLQRAAPELCCEM